MTNELDIRFLEVFNWRFYPTVLTLNILSRYKIYFLNIQVYNEKFKSITFNLFERFAALTIIKKNYAYNSQKMFRDEKKSHYTFIS